MYLKITQNKAYELLDLLKKGEFPLSLTFKTKSGKVELDVYIQHINGGSPNSPNSPNLFEPYHRPVDIELDIIETEINPTNNPLKW